MFVIIYNIDEQQFSREILIQQITVLCYNIAGCMLG